MLDIIKLMKKSVLNIIIFLSTFTNVLQSMDLGLEKESYNFDYSPTIVSGDVSTETVEINNQFQITASDGAVLEFNGFDIGSFWGGEADTPDSVRFIQPSTTAKVYNKIINEEPTVIRGNLEANGHVILINPSGFIFELDQMNTLSVAKLHVIAGIADDDFDNYSLSASISAWYYQFGIEAQSISLAGISVEPGAFAFLDGDVLSVTEGSTFQDATIKLVNADNSLSVPIDSGITVEGLGAVSDLAGQAVLQTGVILASQVQFQPTTVTSTSSNSSSTSDGGNEESTEESAGNSSDESGSKANSNKVKSAVIGVAPFSQISEPILSVEASKILESALSPENEQKMSGFLTP
jgi:filamentous hemagglutinin family protein